ncbi:MAG: PhzF family phenazine biosynthesis protein [Candidatus Eiseniibacteriota bacterium]
MRTILVDAFTRIPGTGNRAGIAPDAGSLNDATMQRVAAAVAASETSFLLPPSPGVDVHLRYFTPGDEIKFCGHATVATFHWLAETGAVPVPGRLTMECPAGRLEIELARDGDRCQVWMSTPRYPYQPNPIAEATLLGLLGGSPGMRDRELPIEHSGHHLLIPLKRRADLWALNPQLEALTAEGERHGVRGYYAFTREASDEGSTTQGRYFAPSLGVREDPVTGSASGILAEYLAIHGVLQFPAGGGPARGRAEQGDVIGKPGRAELEVSGGNGAVKGVRVGGVAVTVLDGLLKSF